MRAEEIAATFLPDAEINRSVAQQGKVIEERSVARPTRRVSGIAIEGGLVFIGGASGSSRVRGGTTGRLSAWGDEVPGVTGVTTVLADSCEDDS